MCTSNYTNMGRTKTNQTQVSYKKVFRAKFQIFCPTFFHAHFCVFTGIFLDFFSRALIWFSRVSFGDFFHGQNQIFTCTFRCNFRFFHVHFFFLHVQNAENLSNFHGCLFFSRPKKKHPLKFLRFSAFCT